MILMTYIKGSYMEMPVRQKGLRLVNSEMWLFTRFKYFPKKINSRIRRDYKNSKRKNKIYTK